MSEKVARCPGCETAGELGTACPEKACSKLGYHFIPEEYLEGEERSDAVVGQMIGDFLVVKPIGSGGFGRVYLALQAPLFRLKGALKLLELPTQNAVVVQALLDKFRQEAEALADLAHPNIVRLLKYGTHDGRPYLVMEYIGNGRTLRDDIWYRAKDGRSYSHEELLDVLGQVLNALEAAHERSIIHRDIKPENIMIQPVAGHPNHLKVLDFGTAKFTEDREDTKWPLGSPSYMAPEQIEMKGLGPWTDLFAVGVMTFELMTGRKPYPGEGEASIVGKKVDRDYDPLVQLVGLDVPETTRNFLMRALAIDPEARFRTVTDYRVALKPAVEALGQTSGVLAAKGPELTSLLDSGDLLKVDPDEIPTLREPSDPLFPEELSGLSEPSEPPPLPEDAAKPRRRPMGPLLVMVGVIAAAAAAFAAISNQRMEVKAPPEPAKELPPPEPVIVAEVPDLGRPDLADQGVEAAVLAAREGVGAALPAPPKRITAVTAGKFHSCVSTFDSRVRCWGANFDGELGLGHDRTLGDDEPLTKVPWVRFDDPIVQLESAGDRGSSFNCALSESGLVRCWGSNSTGQLGLGHTKSIGDENVVGGPGHGNVHLGGIVKDIAVGGAQYGSHACALLVDGTVRCWGGNKAGQLGLGHTSSIGDNELPERSKPADIGGAARDVVAGKHHTCALLETGDVRCWGFNKDGQLGLGHTESVGDDELPSASPPVDVGFEVGSLAAGRGHTCAVSTSGDVKCWGWNNASQLGYGHTDTMGDDEKPSSLGAVKLGAKAVAVVAGGLHTCALLEGGRVKCWGDNKFGQLGYGHENGVPDPAVVGDVVLGGPVAKLYAGSYHTCAVLEDDSLRCWGYNKFGQLGLGHTKDVGDDELPASVPAVKLFEAR